jgi:hypothetical protein
MRTGSEVCVHARRVCAQRPAAAIGLPPKDRQPAMPIFQWRFQIKAGTGLKRVLTVVSVRSLRSAPVHGLKRVRMVVSGTFTSKSLRQQLGQRSLTRSWELSHTMVGQIPPRKKLVRMTRAVRFAAQGGKTVLRLHLRVLAGHAPRTYKPTYHNKILETN